MVVVVSLMSADAGGLEMKIGNADYGTLKTPKGYRCDKCRASGVKLWRDYNAFLSDQTLRCADCLCQEKGLDPSKVTPEGKGPCALLDGMLTDQLGSRIPAVPTEKDNTYWGYSSVPEAGVVWWKRLPLRKGEAGPTVPDAAPAEAPPPDLSVQVEEAEYLVEATHQEKHSFWAQWHKRLDWEGISMGHSLIIGWLRTIPTGKRLRTLKAFKNLEARPINVCVFFARLNGVLVGFYEVVSTLSDQDVVDEWLETLPNVKKAKKAGDRAPHCNADNFHHCLFFVQDQSGKPIDYEAWEWVPSRTVQRRDRRTPK